MSRLIPILLCTAVLAGCLEDKVVWRHERQVEVDVRNFKKCVPAAISHVPGIFVDHGASLPDLIAIRLTLAEKEQVSGAIATVGKSHMTVYFEGKGTAETPRIKLAIDPAIDKLVRSLEQECSSKAQS